MNTISREGVDESATPNTHGPVLVEYERYGVPNSVNKDPGFGSLVTHGNGEQVEIATPSLEHRGNGHGRFYGYSSIQVLAVQDGRQPNKRSVNVGNFFHDIGMAKNPVFLEGRRELVHKVADALRPM